MCLAIAPRTRWGKVRMIILASILPLLFLAIWLFTVKMPGPAFAGPLAPLTPAQEVLRARLEHHVQVLAREIGVRSDDEYANVQRAAAYIEGALRYAVVSQEFSAGGRGRTYRNLEATLAGTTLRREVVLLGAHYDTAEGALGADDNASGVAGVLELARAFAHSP